MSRQLRLLHGESGLVEITSRTQHGRFLMRPSPGVNVLILGVLGKAQARYDVILHAFVFLSNHLHILATVLSPEQLSLFMAFFKGNLAKELGRLYNWREKFWGRRYHSASVSGAEEVQVFGREDSRLIARVAARTLERRRALPRRSDDAGNLVRPHRTVSCGPAWQVPAFSKRRDRALEPTSVPQPTKRSRAAEIRGRIRS